MEKYACMTRIISGAGAIGTLSELGIRRLLLVTDPFFAKNGTADRVAAAAKAESEAVFDGVKPDPDVTLAAEGTAKVREFQPDWIVALGGGSAMDCAKAMAFFSGTSPKIAAIPTTSGSGSEVTDFAVLTHGGVKYPLVDSRLQPAVAILDSDLLAELPAHLIADAGFDVLSHAVEALGATNSGAITDALARDAFCEAFRNLGASFAGDRLVRAQVHMAATMAGMAFSQAGLGMCHALSHSLGGAYHVPHGRLNAILLSAVIGVNAEAVGHKYAQLARAAGLGGSVDTLAVRNLRNGLTRLRHELKLPETLAEAGIDPDRLRRDADAIIASALADPCCKTNPVKCTEKLLRGVLEEVTGRG